MTNEPGWVLSTREFRLLWEQCDAAPYPAFAYDGAEHDANGDLTRLANKRLLAHLATESTALKQAAFTAFTKPRYSFEVLGAAQREGAETPELIRAYSAWDGVSQSVFTARQSAIGADVTVGGDVVIRRSDFDGWTASLVSMVCGANNAGRLPQDADVPVQRDRWLDGYRLVLAPGVSKATAAAAFLHLQQSLGVVVTVRVGSIVDGRQPTTQVLRIADVVDDGRYALLLDSPAMAAAVDNKKLASLLNKVVNATKKCHDAAVVSA